MKPECQQSIAVQSYKHDGSIHRTWTQCYVIESTDSSIVTVTDHTWVVEGDGRKWLTREPAINFFWMHRWYNVISMIRKSGIYFYCNLASPAIYDGEALKYIDYDLDVKLFPDGRIQLLDENEYAAHGREMGYSSDLKAIVEQEKDHLIEIIKKGEKPFDNPVIEAYYSKYRTLLEQK